MLFLVSNGLKWVQIYSTYFWQLRPIEIFRILKTFLMKKGTFLQKFFFPNQFCWYYLKYILSRWKTDVCIPTPTKHTYPKHIPFFTTQGTKFASLAHLYTEFLRLVLGSHLVPYVSGTNAYNISFKKSFSFPPLAEYRHLHSTDPQMRRDCSNCSKS